MRIYIKILLLALVITSCKKKGEPPNGDYIGNFYGTNTITGAEFNTLDLPIVITESTDSTLVANDYTLYPLEKKGDSLIGHLNLKDPDYSIPIYIRAVWTKKWRKYTISGYYQAFNHLYHLVEGNFEIKTD